MYSISCTIILNSCYLVSRLEKIVNELAGAVSEKAKKNQKQKTKQTNKQKTDKTKQKRKKEIHWRKTKKETDAMTKLIKEKNEKKQTNKQK